MFKMKNNRILINRGDMGTVIVAIPIIDANGFIKYTDEASNVYWYDKEEEILYDNKYNESDANVNSMTIMLMEFEDGDIIRFRVYGENEMDFAPYIDKKIVIQGKQYYANIPLTSEDTKIGEYTNEKTKYWWEVELNGEQTIIGFDDKGPKIFMLYPEGMVINE